MGNGETGTNDVRMDAFALALQPVALAVSGQLEPGEREQVRVTE